MTENRDYRDTVFLPQTDFPMKAGLPEKEPHILARWQEADLYAQLREARSGREKFILHDGPPYANGDIHIGHALNKVLKDAVVRSQTLLGKDAPYVPGWDCHGLPIEWKVEEAYRKKKLNKDEVPAEEFRAECRAYAAQWVEVQKAQFQRLGISGKWDQPYLTMAPEAEAAIVAELLKFAETGQLYRGAKPVMWSPVEKTALAEAEVEYEDITSTQIDVTFEIVESPIAELVGAHAVIWTTTPWTIPVNQALAYGPEVDYILIEALDEFAEPTGQRYLVATELYDSFRSRIRGQGNPNQNYATVDFFVGETLAGTICRHPMHHLGGFYAEPRPLLPGDFVTTDSGTGLVHMAPDHGEDDFALCKAHGINPKFVVEADGRYREDWLWLPRTDARNMSVINPKFNAPDGPICSDLKEAGALLAASTDYQHSYPHSWRSKAKVIYRCTPQWFVPMDKPVAPFDYPVAPLGGIGGAVALAVSASKTATLRETAIKAIADTRFVPEKGRNRIGSMVEGRPDWVLSRQRAWGVPITLFVDRKTGEYLVDPEVNARIIAAVREKGVDAWSDEAAPALLGPDYNVDDYERVVDILDVWFDSGSTHAFVLESGVWPELQSPADLYLEGSDQHRGWFQSSLLESCATRGRAPYKAVLTHGFTMDAKGMKMSKSLGNTVSPLDVMRDYGADIIRLWALSVDYTEDHRIGPEILKGVADQYRKLRNTFRYLLGALDGYTEAEALPVDQMPELERYMLALLGELDGKMRAAVDAFDFNTYTRSLIDFCNEDLSAFFFDIRKDCLYCDHPADPKRRAYRTVLDTMFHALIRYAAPVLVFTSEEVWASRYPTSGSVHLLEWPVVPAVETDASRWNALRELRTQVTEAIEPLRREKTVRSSLEAEVTVSDIDGVLREYRDLGPDFLAEIFISGPVAFVKTTDGPGISRTEHHKCGRCWRHLPEVAEDGDLCARCDDVVTKLDAEA
ncbi:isoleucine--tRNA ligase [Alteraurantiacibacter buctensis]|uniref:Isoleucine--tRNA ligase n=1 Tax=Alteraurantiacibacter buctensis TaxID=1503981 RepID=A0A844YVV2_9SPHN|nr:isoleucine--tRNA ligase [Alteraurantiacibacter buctensis]MXO70594.1 isoleucine--tRNA ligase [Alteraurantiacibacter buctensis]